MRQGARHCSLKTGQILLSSLSEACMRWVGGGEKGLSGLWNKLVFENK